MTKAVTLLKKLNPNMLTGYENDLSIGIEDIPDPNGRLFRLEYKSSHDGEQAVSFCLHHPWDKDEVWQCHLLPSGLICTGERIHDLCPNPQTFDELKSSPYTLRWTVERSRYWCSVYSEYRRHGHLPTDY